MPPKGWKKRPDGTWTNKDNYNWTQGGTITDYKPEVIPLDDPENPRKQTKYDKYAGWVAALWTLLCLGLGIIMGAILW